MLLELANTPRDYAWGSTTGIADFLGAEPTGAPEAELWLGTHPGSPARAIRAVPATDEEHTTLAEWIAAHPELLGDALAPAGDLPILLKILAAASPLSLQVHPTPEQARIGFAAEEAAGVALDNPARNYKDPFPKPEIIVAVTERFSALCGFRPADEVAQLIDELGADDDAATIPLREMLADPTRVADALDWLLSGADAVAPCVEAIVAHAETSEAAGSPLASTWQTVREIAHHYPGDAGVVVAMLMNRVDLRRGEGLFAPAGLLHAYLSGVGIELMTASDNVVRGGLTPKHIDTAELRALLSFEQSYAQLLNPVHQGGHSVRYDASAPFSLTLVEPEGGTAEVALEGPSIVLVESASLTIESDAGSLELPQGGSAFVDATTATLSVTGGGRLWIATALAG